MARMKPDAARLDDANAHPSNSSSTGLRFPGEDGGQSLAKLARSDFDATLQLLAERAQYVTGASGAAIALRREEYSDMLCRASSGSSAPELGAVLSVEHGLAGESVRTGQALSCEDAENDPRVSRASCRQLRIASVVVMPILSEGQVLGVFELFSDRVHAFDERDIAALQRLSAMVETAVKHAAATETALTIRETASSRKSVPPGLIADYGAEFAAHATPTKFTPAPEAQESSALNPENAAPKNLDFDPTSKNPLFWSASVQTSSTAAVEIPEAIPVAPVLRSLDKCQACGFPVSPGRTLCVECEEKKWHRQAFC